MSILTQKLQQASKLYQSQNFKLSLQAYQDCIKFCHRTHQDQSILLNIMSTKAALQYLLGEFDEALVTLNSVLSKDCCHFLSLMHRSKVYKQKNKLKRAFKDLEQILVFCPDNPQLLAMKSEIEELLIKQGKGNQLSSQSEQQNQQVQENSLKFMNLKNIDRASKQTSSRGERKSRVTILGDNTYEYNLEQRDEILEDFQQTHLEKALRTQKEIESDHNIQQAQPIINVIAPKKSKKSILKNKDCGNFIQIENAQQKELKYLGRQSKLISLIKNIDGKVISSADHLIQTSAKTSAKQVQFRKSVSLVPLQHLLVPKNEYQIKENTGKVSNSFNLGCTGQRRSCLKRSSYDVVNILPRRSKFEEIGRINIDGKMLIHSKRRSIQQGQIEREKGGESGSDNQGSQHNIFGSKGIFVSQDLKMRLGLLQAEPQLQTSPTTKDQNKLGKMKPKQSILKKNSSILVQKKVSMKQPQAPSKHSFRSKKSVMFNCTL